MRAEVRAGVLGRRWFERTFRRAVRVRKMIRLADTDASQWIHGNGR